MSHDAMHNVRALHLRTPAQAKQWLAENGISAAQFSRARGLNYMAVRDVLCGRIKGKTGHGHAAAVALGIKPPPRQPIQLSDSPAPTSQP